MSKGRAAVQVDLDRLEEWTQQELYEFRQDKHKALHLRGPGNYTGWRLTREQFCGKGLGRQQADHEPAV